MSWHYSVVLVEECLEAGYLTRKSSARLKESRMLSRSCFDDKRTGRSIPSRSGTTSKPSRDFLSVGSLMWSLRGSLASPSVKQEAKKEKTTTETSGPIQQESSGRYDPELSSWRTSPDCFGHTEELSSATFPKWGTTVGGELFPLEKPELATSENGGGAWPTPRAEDSKHGEATDYELGRERGKDLLHVSATRIDGGAWPTPTSTERSGINPNTGRGGGLSRAVKDKWPTPTVGDSKSSGSRNTKNSKAHPGVSLTDAVRGDGGKGRPNWMTPTVQDCNNNGGESQFRRNTLPLNAQVQDRKEGPAWPTPQARDWKNPVGERYTGPKRSNDLNDATDPVEQGRNGRGGKLNPDWVEWLMGWPVGWTSLDPLPAGELERWQKQVEEGTYWDVDPADSGEIPRLTDIKLHRVARLKAAGNGQVPIQLAVAVRCLEGAR